MKFSPLPTQPTASTRSNQIGWVLGCAGAVLVGVLLIAGAGYLWYRTFRAEKHPEYFGKIRPPAGQELRYFQDQPEKLDPHLTVSEEETRIVTALFDGLTDWDSRGVTRPSLAERWEINNDATVWTFHLRRDAKWSDGTPLTAQDVVYSWKRALSPETASGTASLLLWLEDGAAYNQRKAKDIGVHALDDYTLQVNLAHPAAFFDKLVSQPIFRPVPRQAITRWGDNWATPEHIVTSGAFKLAEWTPKKRLVVERNNLFWDNRNTRLDKIIFLAPKNTEKADSSEGIDSYEAGEVDAIAALTRDQSGPLRDKKDFLIGPSAATEFVIINLNIKPLDDTRVRSALSMAIDREELTKESHGLWRSLTGFVPPLEGYEGARGNSYDPEQARRLLSEAGYPDGRGFPEIELIFDSGSTKRPEFLQASLLRELGIKLKLNSQDYRSFLRSRAERKFNGLARGGWLPDYLDPYAFLNLLTKDGDSNAGWKDTKYDELLRRANSEVDQQRRATLLREAEAYMLSQQPVIPLTYYSVYFLCKPYVKNLVPNPLNQPDWRSIYIDSTITAKSLGS